MREIRFRAWDLNLKRFWIADKIYGPGTYWDITAEGYVDATHNNVCRDSEDFILHQFTGLKDKNGKDIYEGDIMRFEFKNFNGDSWISERYVVKFEKGRFIGEAEGEQVVVSGDRFEEGEVIGNIYENPELLESQDNAKEKCNHCGKELEKYGCPTCEDCFEINANKKEDENGSN